jgi:hypothetical protein
MLIIAKIYRRKKGITLQNIILRLSAFVLYKDVKLKVNVFIASEKIEYYLLCVTGLSDLDL